MDSSPSPDRVHGIVVPKFKHPALSTRTFNLTALPTDLILLIIEAIWELPLYEYGETKWNPGPLPILNLARTNKWFHRQAMEQFWKTPLLYSESGSCASTWAPLFNERRQGVWHAKGLITALKGRMHEAEIVHHTATFGHTEGQDSYAGYDDGYYPGDAQVDSHHSLEHERAMYHRQWLSFKPHHKFYCEAKHLLLNSRGLKDFQDLIYQTKTNGQPEPSPFEDPEEFDEDYDYHIVEEGFPKLRQIYIKPDLADVHGWVQDKRVDDEDQHGNYMRYGQRFPKLPLIFPTEEEMTEWAHAFIDLFPSVQQIRIRRAPLPRGKGDTPHMPFGEGLDDKQLMDLLRSKAMSTKSFQGSVPAGPIESEIPDLEFDWNFDLAKSELSEHWCHHMYMSRPWTRYEAAVDAFTSDIEQRLKKHDEQLEKILNVAIRTKEPFRMRQELKALTAKEADMDLELIAIKKRKQELIATLLHADGAGP